MATRGSYQIDGFKLYVHWDNYPAGAAVKFCETIKKYGKIDFLSFVRAEERAQLAANLNKSGEEYSYKVEAGKITAYSVGLEDERLIFISHDSIENWINREIKQALTADDNPADYRIIKTFENYYQTETQIIAEAKQKYAEGVRATEAGHIGNGSSNFHDAFRAANFLPENEELNAMRIEYKAKWAPLFAKKYNHSDTTLFDSYAEILADE